MLAQIKTLEAEKEINGVSYISSIRKTTFVLTEAIR